MFKKFRIFILLTILLGVAYDAYRTRMAHADWNKTQWVAIYPINADARQSTTDYISSLQQSDFESIKNYITQEAQRYGLNNPSPIVIKLGPEIKDTPPQLSRDDGLLATIWWSLKLRYWASHVVEDKAADIRIFISYYDPDQHNILDHSLGLSKLSVATVKAFASHQMHDTNNVVITHELLHIFGATDKYDPATNLPVYPDGYAEPDKDPRHPQNMAEIMAGRIPISPQQAVMPRTLHETRIGNLTATEIHWVR